MPQMRNLERSNFYRHLQRLEPVFPVYSSNKLRSMIGPLPKIVIKFFTPKS